jgi:hypothetical protein
MKRQVVAAAFAVFVSYSAAQAIDVKSYDADAAFARKVQPGPAKETRR